MTHYTKDNIFIVTGASSGIGQGVAWHLNAEGASVIAIGRNEKGLKETKEKSNNPSNLHIEIIDLSDDIEALPKHIIRLRKTHGKLQGMAYCAGIVEENPLQLLELDAMRDVFDINYNAPMFMAKGFADRRNNVGKGAAIVFVSGMVILSPNKAQSTYAASKAALTAAATSIAKELAPAGVRVNSVLPSDIDTPMTQKSLGREERLSHYPFGFGKVEDASEMIGFLLSDKAKWITAQQYPIDCGSV